MLGSLSYAITAKTAPLKQKLGEAKNAMTTTDKTMKSTGKNIAASSKKMSQSAGAAIAPMEQGLSAINPAAGSAVQGMKSMSMAAKGLNAALGPIGLVIGALGTAIAALTSYFKGSVDGQEKMAKIMGYLEGVAMFLKDRFIELGRWLTKAFDDPQQAVKDLWTAIKQNIVIRFEGMVKMVQAGWAIISNGAKGAALAVKGIFNKKAREESKEYFKKAGEAAKDFGEGFTMAMTGVEDPLGKINEALNDINAKGKEISALEQRSLALRLRIANESVKIAKLDAEIAENRKIANDDQNDLNTQIEAMGKALADVDKKHKMLLSQKQEELAIQIANNEAGESNTADIEAQKKLEVELILLKKKQSDYERNLLRRQSALNNEKEAEGKITEKSLGGEKEKRAEILEEIRAAGLTEIQQVQETMQAKLDAFEWSEAEQLKIREHYQGMINALREEEIENEKEATEAKLAEIERQKAAEEEAQNQKIEKQMEYLRSVMQGISIVRQFQDAAMQQELKQAGDNEKKKDEIRKKYAKKMKATAISEAIVGTALAVINALQTEPFIPMGLIAAALAGAAGGAQIATIAAQPMATGGVIPPGYAGDTYPAMLSSGETVLPPDRLPEFGASKVKFRIEGRDLVGILDEQSNINYNF